MPSFKTTIMTTETSENTTKSPELLPPCVPTVDLAQSTVIETVCDLIAPDLIQALYEPLPAGERHYDRYALCESSEPPSRPTQTVAHAQPFVEPPAEVARGRIAKWESMLRDWPRYYGSPADIEEMRRTGVWPARAPKAAKLRDRVLKGVPDQMRRHAWQALLGAEKFISSGTAIEDYHKLLRTYVPRTEESAIGRDIRRCFPRLELLQTRTGLLALSRVLHAVSASNPHLGYVQPYSFIAATFLAYMPEHEAFWSMHALLSRGDDSPLGSVQHLLADCAPGSVGRARVLTHLLAGTDPAGNVTHGLLDDDNRTWRHVLAAAAATPTRNVRGSNRNRRDALECLEDGAAWAVRHWMTFFCRDLEFPVAVRLFDRYLLLGEISNYAAFAALIQRELRGPKVTDPALLMSHTGTLPSLASPAFGTGGLEMLLVQRLMTMPERVGMEGGGDFLMGHASIILRRMPKASRITALEQAVRTTDKVQNVFSESLDAMSKRYEAFEVESDGQEARGELVGNILLELESVFWPSEADLDKEAPVGSALAVAVRNKRAQHVAESRAAKAAAQQQTAKIAETAKIEVAPEVLVVEEVVKDDSVHDDEDTEAQFVDAYSTEENVE